MGVPIVSTAASKLESRFVVNALVPTLVYLPLVLGVAAHAIWGLPHVFAWYVGLPPALLVLTPLGFIAMAWLIASLVASQWDRMVTIYEGYPFIRLYEFVVGIPVVGALADLIYVPGKLAHQKRRAKMAAHAQVDEAVDFDLHLSYPELKEHVLPTRLGNILRAAELYPRDRYGIDTLVLWTRLAMLLPSELLKEIERTIMQYQLPLVISFWSAVLAGSSLFLVWAGQVWLFLGIFATSVGMSAVAYYLALPAAEHYGIALRSVFDVYRDQLLEKWDGVLTADLDREDFQRLRRFIVSGKRSPKAPAAPDPTATQDQSGSSARLTRRQPKWAALQLPRWRTIVICVAVLTAVASWRWVTTHEILVGIVAEPAQPFEAVTVEALQMSIHDAGGRQATLDETIDVDSLVSLHHLVPGDVIHDNDYVLVAEEPSYVFELSQQHESQLVISSGDKVSLVFPGEADMSSDPACRPFDQQGIDRVIDAHVLIPPDDSGRLVVGTGADGGDRIRCYTLEGVQLVQRG